MVPRPRRPGYVFWNPNNGMWCGVISMPNLHVTYHRDTWRDVFDIIDNEVRNIA